MSTLVHGPLAPLFDDPRVTEILVNGPDDVYAEVGGRLQRADVAFRDAIELRQTVVRLVGLCGRRIDDATPLVDARLPDGSRLNAVLPPLAVDGPLLTIRRFGVRRLTIDDLLQLGSMQPEQAVVVRSVVEARLNVLISGGTSSGKTTLLAAIVGLIDPGERIVSVEDAAELALPVPHVARLEARPASVEGRGAIDVRALVRNALRMRPDRLVVGEVRGGEALDLLLALNTGHDGSLATVHANGPADALRRLETMALMAGVDLPHGAIRESIATAVHVVVHVDRRADGRRVVSQIASVDPAGDGWRVAGADAVAARAAERVGGACTSDP
ncbi:MAG: pilus assembly protein CpaF [Gaiellaceae bacterium]|nr:pilus assembly protein CpaF [Gaiellaceae bacterium]